jgi:two-component system response regulator GlrR
MAYHLTLIEPALAHADEGLGPLFGTDFSFERTNWDLLLPESLQRRAAHMVVAVAGAQRAKPLSFFRWLREHPISVPIFAVLPQGADEELLHTALETADDFTLWPTRIARLLGPAKRAVESVRTRLAEEMGLSQLVGNDPAFTRVVEQLLSIARSDAPVLITGETGTGKELCARAIHFLGKRRNFPFIAVDCAAVPDHLFENEFFGHARGAFTDAHRDQKGLAGMAEGGTLFLDEVDALSLAAQAKLLRFLQERVFRPLGADRFERADVNVIAATNCDPESCVRDKQFRSDLYFRLNVLRVYLPPLRERSGDVVLLARHFLEALHKPGDPVRKSFSTGALRMLTLYDWPGNVRELLNVVHRATVACDGTQILPSHIMLSHGQPAGRPPPAHFRAARAAALEAFEHRYVQELLRKHHGNVTHAAREARQDRRAFGRLVKKYQIDRRAL